MKSTFQLILLVALAIIGVVAVLMFSGILPGGLNPMGSKEVGKVTVWAPVAKEKLGEFIEDFNQANQQTVQIDYSQKNPETYENDLIEAFARGNGPDIYLMTEAMLNRFDGKYTVIPYSLYSKRDLLDNFADGTAVFAGTTGLAAMPAFIDPLVMFYNRDMYATAGLATPPATWTDFLATLPAINKIDKRNNVTQTAAPLGEYRNVTNAQAVVSTLLYQAGNPVAQKQDNDDWQSTLSNSFGLSPSPAQAAISFYLQFSDAGQRAYSWNRSLPSDKEMFTAEKAATYFGLASELSDLRAKNPHLNLDAALVPQKDPLRRTVYGSVLGWAIGKRSANQNLAWTAVQALTQPGMLGQMALSTGWTPARRGAEAQLLADPLAQVFRQAALIARAWPDPAPAQTREIFRALVENVQTGQVTIDAAAREASGLVDNLYVKHETNGN